MHHNAASLELAQAFDRILLPEKFHDAISKSPTV